MKNSMKKAQGLPINAIILAVLALIVLVVLVVIFSGRTAKVGQGADTQTVIGSINAMKAGGKSLTTFTEFNTAALEHGIPLKAREGNTPCKLAETNSSKVGLTPIAGSYCIQ
jgi:hypothetical protein